MSVTTNVAGFFRTQWATRLTDTCWIHRETSSSFNPTTGIETPTYTDVYGLTGTPAACLVRPGPATDVDAGQQQTELRFYTVFVPYDQTGIQPDDRVTVTSTTDGQLDGVTLVVRNVTTDTYNHVRRVRCELVVA